MIQITDLRRQYQALETDLQAAILSVCASGQFIKGPELQAFESEMASYLNIDYALGVNSGTDALFLALKAAGVGQGDEVLTTAMTFIATAEAISLTGATPVFVDISPDTECLLPEQLAGVLTPNTRAIIPVHLHGYPCDMDAILAFARAHSLIVVEDCAQSIGATYKGQATGTLGDIGCFSFFPTKNLGAFGDAGMVVTRNPTYIKNLKCLREHGSLTKNYQDMLGVNSRLDAIQAAVLRVKLPHLARWNAQRRELAEYYHTCLAPLELPLRLPPLVAGERTESVFHHYVLRLKGALKGQRDALQSAMKTAGIECLSYYPQPMHLQALYAHRYVLGDLPEAEDCAENGLALPLFPELTENEQIHIVKTLKSCVLKLT